MSSVRPIAPVLSSASTSPIRYRWNLRLRSLIVAASRAPLM